MPSLPSPHSYLRNTLSPRQRVALHWARIVALSAVHLPLLACEESTESDEGTTSTQSSSTSEVVDPYDCPTQRCLIFEQPVRLCSRKGGGEVTDAELPDESGFGRVLPSVLHGPVVLELAAGIYPVDDSGLSAIAGTYEDDGQVVELSANSALVAAPEIDTKVFNDRGVSWLNYEPGWLGNLQVEVAAAALRGTLTIEISRERFASLPHYFFGGADDPLLATRRSIMLKWQPQQMGEDNRALLFEACDLGQQADIPIHVELADERGEIELIVRRLGRQLDMRASSVLQVRSAKGRIDAELFEQNDQDNLFGAYLWLPPRFPSFVIALRDATDVIDALDDTPCFVVFDGQVYTLGDVGSHLGRLYDCLEQPIGEVEVSSVQWPPGLGYANLAEAGMNGAR